MEWRLLAGVPEDQVRELLQIARRRRFARNEVVFHRDDPGDSLHLIWAGHFAIRVMTPVGDVATIAIRGPGDTFGESALLGDTGRRTATVLAVDGGETYAVAQSDVERLRRRHPSIDDALFRFYVGEVRALNERLLEALYVPVEKRVLRRLVDLAALYSRDGETVIGLTQEALAELAGATRSTVNQVLRAEEKRGAIELRRGSVRIVELEDLSRRAH